MANEFFNLLEPGKIVILEDPNVFGQEEHIEPPRADLLEWNGACDAAFADAAEEETLPPELLLPDVESTPEQEEADSEAAGIALMMLWNSGGCGLFLRPDQKQDEEEELEQKPREESDDDQDEEE